MKKRTSWITVTLCILLLSGCFLLLPHTRASAAGPALLGLFGGTAKRPSPVDTLAELTLEPPSVTPVTAAGQSLMNAWEAARGFEWVGGCAVDGDTATQELTVRTLDTSRLGEDLTWCIEVQLGQWLENAVRTGDVYNADHTVRSDLLDIALPGTLEGLLQNNDYSTEQSFVLTLRYADGAWTVTNRAELQALALGSLNDPDAAARAIMDATAAALPYTPKPYALPEDALAGPVPDPNGFGETEDPAIVEALLQRPEAQALIKGQELVWNAGIELIPHTVIRYYLDESILVIVWQEREARGVGTFAEVFIADGSQLRRKIAADTLWDLHFETTTRFAQMTNAVLALGGDFYYHGRNCGIGVYQRQIFRFEPKTCDVCYITGDGDMLFSYREQYTEQAQAEQFIRDNDVLFSLAFGPVLIDNGVDVTPDRYLWGEILDEYARSALGMLGRHHYLTMNINCGNGSYYYLATLRQAADAMIRRGCIKAYTLDGGQTATTVFHGQLVNPVQFGWEKNISDIIYFATGIQNG